MCWLAQGGIRRRLFEPSVVQWWQALGKAPNIQILPPLMGMKLLNAAHVAQGMEVCGGKKMSCSSFSPHCNPRVAPWAFLCPVLWPAAA